ncbi:MAG: AraC family transcriptional regulator [Rhodobacteraceae bacterium PARR1]|nr:MAG: AraC family transcriptional regulator [Rhodobacteraceae bacterium PARR1]
MERIPTWQLYGEASPFPDLLHIEQIVDRAAGQDWVIAAHRHVNLHQIFLIRSGVVELSLDGRRRHPAPPVVINIPPGTVHDFTFAAGTEGHVLTLPPADFPDLFGHEMTALLRAFDADGAGLESMMDAIAARHADSGPLRRLRLRAAAIDLCCAVSERGEGAAETVALSHIPQLEALIRTHLADGWQVTDYAHALRLSDRHLRRLCLEATGLSTHGFIAATRLREACRLLAYTRMQVQEVGFALGFDDPAYFVRVFRQGMHLSPTEYRRKIAGAEGQG